MNTRLTRSFSYLKGHIAAPNPHPQLPLAVSGSSQHNTFGAGAFLNPSPPYSPQYDSPTNREHSCPDFGLPYYHQPRSSRARHASHTSYSGYGAFQQPSSTPDSAGSSTVCLPHWAHNAQDFQGNLNNSSDSEASGTAAGVGSFHNQVMMDHVLLPGAFGSSRLLTADDRDAMERDDLVIPCSSRHDSLVDLSIAEPAYSNEERYLGAYWLWVHQLYPVVHRPSFNLHDASPLLKAAMLALGAHALGDSLDKTNARIVHERCVKVLKRVSKD